MTEEQAKVQIIQDKLDPARVEALNLFLGVPNAKPQPFAHQVYFWEPHAAEKLGRDGHHKTGGLIPDMGLPRRMWAGGRLRFLKPLELGEMAQKASRLKSANLKSGRSGPLALVTLQHEISQTGAVIVEEQDLVYLPEPNPEAPSPTPPIAPSEAAHVTTRKFTTTDLFRYSALTLNGHRIHYDRDYCQHVEGYPGLVVHGPLLAQCLMLMAQEIVGKLQRFEFRATAPLFDFEQAEFCASPVAQDLKLWVRGPDGRQCMTAHAS